MTYNMTAFENSNNVAESVLAINAASDNLLVMSFMMVLFVIVFVRLLRNNPPAESFVAASAVGTILSLVFLAGNLLSYKWVVGFSLLFAIGAVGVYLRNKTS